MRRRAGGGSKETTESVKWPTGERNTWALGTPGYAPKVVVAGYRVPRQPGAILVLDHMIVTSGERHWRGRRVPKLALPRRPKSRATPVIPAGFGNPAPDGTRLAVTLRNVGMGNWGETNPRGWGRRGYPTRDACVSSWLSQYCRGMAAGKGRSSGRRRNPRMNAVLATNVRTIREIKHWTQQHLADTAGILLRTVQRIEKGDGASIETLGALANAFDVSIDFLHTDLAAVARQAQENYEELKRTRDLVPVTPVTCSAHLEIIGGSDASVMHCASEADVVQDAFASLKSNIADMLDIWNDVDPSSHRKWVKSAYEQVEALNELGLVVCVGKAKRTVRTGTGPIVFDTLYLVAWPKGEEEPVIAVEKSAYVGLE
jgi:transcriptional regulator with XRE-family HTH domain